MSSAPETVPSCAVCGHHPASLAFVVTKERIPSSYYNSEKIQSSCGESVAALRFPAFLSHLCLVLGRYRGNLS